MLSAGSGSAPLSPEMTEFMESLLQVPLRDGYGSTEAGGVWRDGVLQRPPVTDYKLVDVPELGYFTTDSPHPRGELRLKSETMFPGYYKRPETTADVFDDEGTTRPVTWSPSSGRITSSTSTASRTSSSSRRRVCRGVKAGGRLHRQPAGPADLCVREQ